MQCSCYSWWIVPRVPSQIPRIKRRHVKIWKLRGSRNGRMRSDRGSSQTGWPSHRFAFATTFKLLKGDTIERFISLSTMRYYNLVTRQMHITGYSSRRLLRWSSAILEISFTLQLRPLSDDPTCMQNTYYFSRDINWRILKLETRISVGCILTSWNNRALFIYLIIMHIQLSLLNDCSWKNIIINFFLVPAIFTPTSSFINQSNHKFCHITNPVKYQKSWSL